MFISPLCLIDQTIDHLESLSEMLTDEVDERFLAASKPEGRLCKETLLTIGVLLPKLKAVRCSPVALVAGRAGGCATCDDN
jgi:hypothetical protein